MKLEYGLFMAERAGLLNTKESRLNRACSQLREANVNIYNSTAVERILAENELDINELSQREHQRVLDCLRR